MEAQVLLEIIEVKRILSHLVGTSDLPLSMQFSTEALDKAAKELRKLIKIDKEWVKQYDLGKYFPRCGDGLGKFIREEFEFSNYFTRSSAIFYNRKDIMALSNELKSRNVDLATYMELRKSQSQLHKRKETAILKNKAKGKKKSYKLEDGLKDIKFSDYRFPEKEVVNETIRDLMQQFTNGSFSDYIQIFGDHAIVKFGASLKRFMPDDVKKNCQTWCNRFNTANYALMQIEEHEKQKQAK